MRYSPASPTLGAPSARTTPCPPKVRLTHPDRVYWPDAGLTKQDLADYYAAVWPRIAPHVAAARSRSSAAPAGTGEACFFQKHPWKGHGRKS